MTNPFSIIDIGRRINALSVQAEVLLEAQTELAVHSIDYQRNAANLDRWLDERRSLQQLAMTCAPSTMEEAAVQLALVFYGIGALLEQEKAEAIQPGVRAIQRAVAGIARVVAGAAAVDLHQFGESDLVYQMDQRCPVKAGHAVPG